MVVVAVGALLAYAGALGWIFESSAPVAAALRRSMRRPSSWVAAGLVTLLGVGIVVPWVYAEATDDAPAPLSFDDVAPLSSSTTAVRSTVPPVTRPGTGAGTGSVSVTTRPTVTLTNPSITAPTPTTAPRRMTGGPRNDPPATTGTTAPVVDSALAGSWLLGPGSVAGYRADEVLVLQRKETAGRTESVTGTMVVEGLTVRSVEVVVDMASVRSNNSQRDEQYRGRIMDVEHFPTSTFVLTSPIELDRVPEDAEVVEREAVGDFTIRGVTRSVTFPLQAQLSGGRIMVLANVPVTWSDYGIPDPSTPLTRVQDHGEIELLLVFDRAPVEAPAP